MISPKIDPMRAQIAVALYPWYLDEMVSYEKEPDDGLPPHDLEAAAAGAVIAADFLIQALMRDPGQGQTIESLTDAIEARR